MNTTTARASTLVLLIGLLCPAEPLGAQSVHYFDWSAISSPQAVGQAIDVIVTARTQSGATATSFGGTVGLSAMHDTGTRTIGTGTNAPSLGNDDVRLQCIYLSSEMGAACDLRSLDLYISQVPGHSLDNFTIRLKHTALTGYGGNPSWESTGWTVVYQRNVTVSATGWMTFAFSTPFAYNGSSSLMVDISYNNTGWSNPAFRFRTSQPGGTRTLYFLTNSAYGDPLNWSGTSNPTPNTTTMLPNIRLATATSGPAINPTTSGSFVSGVWSGQVTVQAADSAVFLRADDGSNHAGDSNVFEAVVAGALDHFDISAIASPQYVNTPFNVTITAKDSSGATAAGFNGWAYLSALAGIGTTSIAGNNGNWNYPLHAVNHDCRSQVIYDRTNFTGACVISDLSLQITSVPTSNRTLNNFTIRMKHTTLDAYPGSPSWESSGWTVVYQNDETITSTGWRKFPFSQEFDYNGTDNLLIDISFNRSATSNNNFNCRYNSNGWWPPNRTIYYACNSTQGDPLAWGGASPAPTLSTRTPDVRLTTGQRVNISPSASGNFVSGSWTGNVSALNAGTDVTLRATDGAGHEGLSSTFDVDERLVDHFEWDAITSPQEANAPFRVTIRAIDNTGQPAAGFTGTVNLSAPPPGITVSPSTTGNFTAGVWTGEVTVPQQGSNVYLRADDGSSHTGDSGMFNVAAKGVDHFTWSAIADPQILNEPFPVTITAKDDTGATLSGFSGTVQILGLAGISTATVGGSRGNWNYPLHTSRHDSRTQSIYYQSQLGDACVITALGLNVTTAPNRTLNNFTIRMKHTTLTSFPASPAWDASGWTVVYQRNETISSTGWRTFDFTTPFQYNGSDNLMVDFSFNNSTAGSDGRVQYDRQWWVNPSIYYSCNSTQGDPLSWSGGTPAPSRSSNYPRIQLTTATGVTISPTSVSDFVNGVWTGVMTAQEVATNLVLRAFDSGGHRGDSNAFDVQTPPVHHFDFSAISSPQSTGDAFQITITAKDVHGVVAAGFTGNVSLITVGGSSVSPSQSGDFLDGVWTGLVTANSAAGGIHLHADDGNGHVGDSNSFDVQTNGVDHFNWAAVSDPQTAGVPFSVTISAKNSSNGTVANFAGAVQLLALCNQVTAGIGSNWGSWSYPLHASNHDCRLQAIYPQSDVGSACVLTKLALMINSVPSTNRTLTNFTIRMKHTTLAEFPGTASWDSSGWTTVYQADETITTTGWRTFTFTTPFDYNGSDNLMVDFSFNRTVSSNTNFNCRYTRAWWTNRSIYYACNSTNGDPLTWTGTSPNPTESTYYPDIQLTKATSVSMSPTSSGSFSNGAWTGDVSVLEACTACFIRADDGNGHFGNSNTFDVNVRPVDHFDWAVISSPQGVGTPFEVTITAKDAGGAVVTSFRDTVNITSVPAGVSLSPAVSGDFVDGVWTGSITVNQTASNICLRADDGSSHTGDSNPFSVQTAGLHHFQWSAIASPQTAGTPFSVTISARDSTGALVAGFTGTVQLSGLPGHSISPTTSGQFVNGSWTGDISVLDSGSNAYLRADDGSGHVGDSNAFDVQLPQVDHFEWDAVSSPQSTNQPFQVTITARDAGGALATGFTGTVNITGLPGGVSLSPSTSGVFVNGQWTGNITVSQAAANMHLHADDGSTHTGDSNDFTVQAQGVDHFTWSAISSPQTVGSPFTVSITARNASNGVVTNFTGTAQLSGLPGVGILPGSTDSFVNGVWTGDIRVLEAAANMFLRADDGSGHTGDSNAFAANAPAVDHFAFDTLSSPQVRDEPFTVRITAIGANGSVASGFTGTVNLSALPGGVPMSPAVTTAFVDGLWTGSVTVNQTASNIHLHADDGSSHTGDSNDFSVVLNGVHHFTWAAISSPQTVNSPFSVTITAKDVNGSTVSAFTDTVTLSGLPGLPISPTVSGSFVNGVWTGNITAQGQGANVYLRATDAGGHSGDSNKFNVDSAAVDHFAWTPIGSAQTSNVPFSVTIRACDAVGGTEDGFVGTAQLSAWAVADVSVASGSPSPYPSWPACHDMRTQIIYHASEIGGACVINAVALDVTQVPDQTMESWTVRMKHTTMDAYGAAPAWEASGWTTVYQSNQTVVSTGWTKFDFTTPFNYNGTDNLLVDFSYNNFSATSDPEARYTVKGQNRTIYFRTDSAYGDPLTWSGTGSPTPVVSPTVLDVRFSTAANVSITPTSTGTFSNGTWTGSVTVHGSAPQLYLESTDGSGHKGQSNTFAVNP